MNPRKLTPLAVFYWIFAAAGAVIPRYFNIVWMREIKLNNDRVKALASADKAADSCKVT